MATPRIGAGFRYIYYGYVDSNGYVHGSTAAGATAGAAAGSPLLRLEGADTIPLSIPEDERVTVTGDDDPLVEFDFDAADLPSGVMTTAVNNLTFNALVLGTSVQEIGDLSFGTLQPSGATSATMCLILQRRSKKWASGNRGTAAWEILVAPRAAIKALGSDWAQRTHNPYNYSVTLSKSDKKSWGATFTSGLNGTTSAPLIQGEADNPIFQDNYKGNNSQQDFTLTHAPVTTAKMHVYQNGVKQTLTTDYTLSGLTLSMVAAPGTDVILNVMYETSEDNLV